MSVTTTPTNPNSIANIVRTLLRGGGQVMFQCNAYTGLFFLLGIFWGAYAAGTPAVAWGALVGVTASTLAGYLTVGRGTTLSDGQQGLWGFNGILVGCAFPTFFALNWQMWVALIICAMITTWVRTGFNNVMAPWKVNSLTFPFVFMTWVFLFCARELSGLSPAGMDDPSISFSIGADPHWSFDSLTGIWLKGISQVFLINSWITGLLFLIGLAVSDWKSAVWAAVASAIALVVALLFEANGASVANGLYGFSAVLTGIALGSVFYKSTVLSAVWCILGIIATVFVQAGMNAIMAPWGLATLTGPFCVTTWLFLLPQLQLDNRKEPDHSGWNKPATTPTPDKK